MRYSFLERLIACRYRIQGNMMFPTGKEDEVFAIQVKGWHVVANGLYNIWGYLMYSLSHLFKDGLGILRKGTDVFVNRREVLFVWHICIIF